MNTPGIYDRHVLPRLLAFAMRTKELVPYRERVGQAASGRVLEAKRLLCLGLGSAGP